VSGVRDRGVLVLDFDGVICDSWRECALVTWGAHHRRPAEDFRAEAVADLPADFLDRFRALRGYARRLGDFLVPVLAADDPITSQQDFDRALGRLDAAVVAEFVEQATEYRATVRDTFRDRWLRAHVLYDGMVGLMGQVAGRLYIVTARDETSVQELLAAHGTHIPSDRIYGSQQSKRAALAEIREREDAWLYFVDDSLPNVVAARADGHRSAWARWGYSAPEHGAEAARLGVPMLALPDLPAAALSVGTAR
jgi:phosphoglycolate phosphatase-like HAD superfamily hydrolase